MTKSDKTGKKGRRNAVGYVEIRLKMLVRFAKKQVMSNSHDLSNMSVVHFVHLIKKKKHLISTAFSVSVNSSLENTFSQKRIFRTSR